MKFLKIILIFIIFISPLNANTIYNLIKIPNLEIYKTNSDNGLKYLKAYKAFEVGVRNDNVKCFNSKIEDIDRKNCVATFNIKEKSVETAQELR